MKIFHPTLTVLFVVFSCLAASAQKSTVKPGLFDDDLPGISTMLNEDHSPVGQNDVILRSASFTNSMVMGPAGAVNASKRSGTGPGSKVAIACTAAAVVALIAVLYIELSDPDSPQTDNYCATALGDACMTTAFDACTNSSSSSGSSSCK